MMTIVLVLSVILYRPSLAATLQYEIATKRWRENSHFQVELEILMPLWHGFSVHPGQLYSNSQGLILVIEFLFFEKSRCFFQITSSVLLYECILS